MTSLLLPLMIIGATALHAAAPTTRTDTRSPAVDSGPSGKSSPLGKKALRTLIIHSQHKDFEIRLEAASAWGEIGNPAAIPILSKSLEDADPFVRIEAAYSLKLLGSDLGMPVLESLMKEYQGTSTKLSTGTAKDPVAEMRQIAKNKVRSRAIDRLSRMGGTSAVKILEKALQDPSGTVRDATSIGLARLGFDEYTLGFIEALEGTDPRARAEAARSIAMIGRPLHLKYLIKAFKNSPDYVRAEIIGALGNFPDAGLVRVLKRAIKDPNPNIRAQAVSSLVRLPEPSTKRVLKAFVKKNEVPAITLKAMAGLAAKGGKVDLQMIRRVLWQKDPDVKLDAIEVLQSSSRPQAIELLKSAMEDDKSDRVRIRAAKALIVKLQKGGKR